MPDAAHGSSVAHQYVSAINSGRYEEVIDLFAADGVFLNPLAQRLEGSAAIRAFLVPHLTRQKPTLRVARCVEGDDECWAEIEIRDEATDDYRLTSANHFTRTGDRIAELRVFLRPQPT